MLVIISDLHFVDETAGKHNVSKVDFEMVFKDIAESGIKPEEIKIIFLGDIFDLNRSTYWFSVPESEKPWGEEGKEREMELHALKILENIAEKNIETFELLRNIEKSDFFRNLKKAPEIIYIPGNHDRLCNLFPTLRKKVREILGIPGESEPFLHVYDDGVYGNKYGLFARHGHEYDVWNFEGSSNFTDKDYSQIPIGDLITTEIAVRLPYTIMKYVEGSDGNLSIEEKETLKRNLEEIDNIRPYTALFDWLFYQVNRNPTLKRSIEKAIQEIVENFNGLSYLIRWYRRHDKWNILRPDEADKLQAILTIFKIFNLDLAEGLARIFGRIFGSPQEMPMDNSDTVLLDKAKDFLTHTSDYRFYVMGHTHNPVQVPVRVTSRGMEQIYINTGTWRKRYVKGIVGGFVGLKSLTYAVFYSREENTDLSFEVWMGTLKAHGSL